MKLLPALFVILLAPVAAIREIVEFNIGHAIIARAIFVGIQQAAAEMKKLVS